jgi:hypothetical protein
VWGRLGRRVNGGGRRGKVVWGWRHRGNSVGVELDFRQLFEGILVELRINNSPQVE